MPFDGSGNFNRVMNWVSDAAALIKIKADRHDQEDDNFASGLSNVITKDGQTQPTANIPLNGKRIINLGAPVNPSDAATKATVDAEFVHGLTNKPTPVDADELLLSNSASTPAWQRAKTTVGALKTLVTGSLGAFIHALTAKPTLVDADELLISDSVSTPTAWASKRHTWLNLQTMIGIAAGQRLAKLQSITLANLNSAVETGWYADLTGTAVNSPLPAMPGYVEVYAASAVAVTQIFTSANGPRQFRRAMWGGAWGAWSEITAENALFKVGQNSITAGSYIQTDTPGDAPVGGIYRPSPLGGAAGVGTHASPGNVRLLTLTGIGAFTFNAPTTAGNYSMAIMMQNGTPAPTPTFAGFTKVVGTIATANKGTLAFVVKAGGFNLLTLEPQP